MIWEYKTLPLPSSAERQEMLSEMGLNGWELIGFEQGLAYFKREKMESVPQSSPEAIAVGLGISTSVVLEDFSKSSYTSQSQRSKKK